MDGGEERRKVWEGRWGGEIMERGGRQGKKKGKRREGKGGGGSCRMKGVRKRDGNKK